MASIFGDSSTQKDGQTPLTMSGINLALRIDNLDFVAMSHTGKVRDDFFGAIKYAIVFYIGRDMKPNRVAVTLKPETKLVHAYFVPPCGVNVQDLEQELNFTSLSSAIASNLRSICCWKEHPTQEVHSWVMNSQQFAANCNISSGLLSDQLSLTLPVEFPSDATEQRSISISGATGASASIVNGLFVRAPGLLNGKLFFQKLGDDDLWLVFELNRWYVTDTHSKNSDEGGGWLYSMEEDAANPVDAKRWKVWSGAAWVQQNVTVEWKGSPDTALVADST